MLNSKVNELLIKDVIKYINNDKILTKKFYHPNMKYKIEELLKYIIFITRNGISFRCIQGYTKIHWNTIYKFHLKLIKYNIFENMYTESIDVYLNKIDNKSNKYFTVKSKLNLLFSLIELRSITVES